MRRITGFDDYAISENGECYSFKHHRRTLMKPVLAVGYPQVGLRNKECRKYFKIHRLVAMMYIPNPENKPCINHKDGNKLNNNVSNLEWVTVKENTRHAYKNGLAKSGADHYAARLILDTQAGVFYYSVKEVSALYGINPGTMYAMLAGLNYNYTNLVFA